MEIDSFNRCSIEAKADTSVLNSDSSSDTKTQGNSIRTYQVDDMKDSIRLDVSNKELGVAIGVGLSIEVR
jgi:hypothetical protein